MAMRKRVINQDFSWNISAKLEKFSIKILPIFGGRVEIGP
jgi:hypothetical protein